jgi:hypothetical protein
MKKILGLIGFFWSMTIFGQNYNWTVVNETGNTVKVTLEAVNRNPLEKILSSGDNSWTINTNWCFAKVRVDGQSGSIQGTGTRRNIPTPCSSNIVIIKINPPSGSLSIDITAQ